MTPAKGVLPESLDLHQQRREEGLKVKKATPWILLQML
jgi:hypothetical protein